MNLQLTPYMLMNGKANEAVDFYQKIFDAEVESKELLKDWPQEFDNNIPEGYEDNVMHAHLNIGNTQLMLADVLPKTSVSKGAQVTIMIDVNEEAQAEDLYKQLSDGGEVIMPLQKTGFSPAAGHVRDRFGIEWQIIAEYPELSVEEGAEHE